MFWTALRRLHDEDDGFTLIELMVVVMILAILIVMGMPTFLGVKARFQDRGAQTDLRNSVLAARIMYTDAATFASATSGAAGLVTIVPNMCYVAGTAATKSVDTGVVACASGAGSGSISVDSNATSFMSARLSASQSCFVILDATTGTKYGETTAANCYADWALANAGILSTTPAGAGW